MYIALLISEYAGHATDVIKNLRLDDWSGVVIVSGDGLIYEVSQMKDTAQGYT